MKISAGISEIYFPRVDGYRKSPEKVFIWPQYGAGRVGRIRGIIRRTESNVIYSKPLGEDIEKVLAHNKNYQREYTSNGRIDKRNNEILPGMLFEAIV